MGRHFEPSDILDLLIVLLGDPGEADPTSTLASLGIDDDGLIALWDAVCEEFAERSVGPELEPGTLEAFLSLEAAASAMARLLEDAHPRAG